MNILKWLSKLGILRWGGTAGVYRNAIERPIELQAPDVFNAERDLTQTSKEMPPSKQKSTESDSDKSVAKR